jgi:hypothetical protein
VAARAARGGAGSHDGAKGAVTRIACLASHTGPTPARGDADCYLKVCFCRAHLTRSVRRASGLVLTPKGLPTHPDPLRKSLRDHSLLIRQRSFEALDTLFPERARVSALRRNQSNRPRPRGGYEPSGGRRVAAGRGGTPHLCACGACRSARRIGTRWKLRVLPLGLQKTPPPVYKSSSDTSHGVQTSTGPRNLSNQSRIVRITC